MTTTESEHSKKKLDSRLRASIKVLHICNGSDPSCEGWHWGPQYIEKEGWSYLHGGWNRGCSIGVLGILPNLEKLVYHMNMDESAYVTWDFWKSHLDRVKRMDESWKRPMMEVLFISTTRTVLARRHANGEFEDLTKTPMPVNNFLK